MSDRGEEAVRRFGAGFNCAQSVLLAFAGELGMDEATAARVSCAFGAGMGRRGRVCGALSGGLMALGLRFGMAEGADQAAKEKTYELARDLVAAFESRHGGIDCRDLLGCDIGTPEGMAQMKARGLHGTLCARLVRETTEMVERLVGPGQKKG